MQFSFAAYKNDSSLINKMAPLHICEAYSQLVAMAMQSFPEEVTERGKAFASMSFPPFNPESNKFSVASG